MKKRESGREDRHVERTGMRRVIEHERGRGTWRRRKEKIEKQRCI